MRKKKTTRKKTRQPLSLTTKIIVVIISLIILAIALFEWGLVGKTLATGLYFILGDHFQVLTILLVVLILWSALSETTSKFKLRSFIATFLLIFGVLIIISVIYAKDLTGRQLLEEFLSKSHLILKRELPAGGGIIGTFSYSILYYLVAKNGSLFVAGGSVLIALVLVLNFSKSQMQEKLSRPKSKVKDEKVTESILKRTSKLINLKADEGKSKVTERKEVVLEIAEAPRTSSVGTIKTFSNYNLPNLDLLEASKPNEKTIRINEEAANRKGKRLMEILSNFGIVATLLKTHIGPSVTKFEVRPESTIKINRINAISDNIKMELAAKNIRIESPIPGRNAVGIEIPNEENTPVRLYELMRSIPSVLASKQLLLALGKDLLGHTVYCELDKMPHLLIAGATGSGKSVAINSIITTLLLRTSPNEVKLVLIDPKKVEFTQFEDVPHLMSKIISDANEASRGLKRIVEIMENRYNDFSKIGVRNITGYNEYVRKHPNQGYAAMYWIVVIIDELADLMATAGKEVELSIQRITQLARAAGIHLIVATQRPSTDVITGIIKTNIPSRIAFAVTSGTDSRIILDQTGAERLLGNGDMLYFPVGEPAPLRLQGVFVTDQEVTAVASFAKSQMKPDYDPAFENLEVDTEGYFGSEAETDELYEEILDFVIAEEKASTSLLQRRFGIGYNRAARIIDALEARGVIGPVQGSKPRNVLIKSRDELD